jgi:hypothetical protein
MNPERSWPEGLKLGAAGARWARIAAICGVVGLVVSILIATIADEGSSRFYRSYLANYAYFLSIALGALFLVMITHLTRAGWSIAIRRVAEAVAFCLIPLTVLVIPVVFGMHDLYEWTHGEAIADDALLQGKQPYLNQTFFIIRLIVYFGAWLFLAWYFASRSTRQDSTGDPRLTLRMERMSAVGMIVFAFTVTFAAFDFLMSLAPHWYSTIYGVYYFSGAVVGILGFLIILLSLLQRGGRLRHVVSTEHYHDLGRLLFAFVVFWAYIAFSQYMLIWYANLPEETVYYFYRQEGQWVWITLLLLFGHFILPFLALISRHPKRRVASLVAAAAWLLVMHWIDVYWLVMPESSRGVVPLHLLDLTLFIGLGGLFVAAVLQRLARHPLIPIKDPKLHESVQLESA